MSSLDGTPAGTESSARINPWVPIVTTVTPFVAAVVLALTGNGDAAAAAAAGGAAGAIHITVRIRR